MPTTDQTEKIPARKRGNALGFWFFSISVRTFGLRGAYGLLYIVCTYYLFFDREAVKAALAYLKRRFPEHSIIRLRFDAYLLFVSQGKNLIDRYYLLAGGPALEIIVENRDRMSDLIKNQQGCVLLMAHIGNWQVIMTALRQFNRKVYLLMRPEDNKAVAESLKIDAGGDNISIISAEDPLGSIVAVMDAIKNGGIVSIMGDRSYSFTSVDVDFLGDPARFSCGAFHIAALAGCPVVMLTSAKTSHGKYLVNVAETFQPRYEPKADKKKQLRNWVQQFACLIEKYVDKYPYQCFLFYDIWRDADALSIPEE